MQYKQIDRKEFLPCNHKGEILPSVKDLYRKYDTSFKVSRPESIIHDFLDHVNSTRYLGGVADEIMAIGAVLSHSSYLYREKLYSKVPINKAVGIEITNILYDLHCRNYDWGDIPNKDKFLNNAYDITKGKYFEEFEPILETIDIDYIIETLEEEYQLDESNLPLDLETKITTLIYLGAVKAKLRWNVPTMYTTSISIRSTLLEHLDNLFKSTTGLDYIRLVKNKDNVSVYKGYNEYSYIYWNQYAKENI